VTHFKEDIPMTRPSLCSHVFAGVALLLALMTTAASAAVSSEYQQWREGPAQWILTADEQRGWKAVKTDEEAIRFVDLFWARRDPTTGTARNEFRDEFDTRVQFSDRAFEEKNKRGALTDRGRVYIVLGAASNMGTEATTNTKQMGLSGYDPTGGRAMGARSSWIWDFKDSQKFDMPKIEVVFIEDPVTRKVQRDPQRGDFIRASQVAIRKAVVAPELAEVPSWALTGGLEVVAPAQIQMVPAANVKPVPSIPVVAEPEPVVAPVASRSPGASRLTLFKDAAAVTPGAPTDPFAAVSSAESFGRKETLNWAVQYCAAAAEVPKLKYLVHIAGPFEGDSSERVTREKEIRPAAVKAIPGCYLLRGSMPLGKFPPGSYEVGVLIDDTVTRESYHLKRDLKIQ
jgi:GWxTD domain-containing protein